tara:strand:+ start:168 stop:749 length:582 start_codon:yes stop_codon:yes gene_type:complete
MRKHIIVAVFLIILLSNILIISLNTNFYKNEFSKHNIYNKFNKEDLDNNFTLTINYLNNKNELNKDFYTQREILHLKDIKNLVMISKILLILSIISLSFSKNKTNLLKGISKGSKYLLITTIIIGILFLFKFQTSFIYFHKIFFTNNLWLLNENHNLIKMLPGEIFKDLILKIVKYIIASSVILLVISNYLRK